MCAVEWFYLQMVERANAAMRSTSKEDNFAEWKIFLQIKYKANGWTICDRVHMCVKVSGCKRRCPA